MTEQNTQLIDPKDIMIARQFAGVGQRINIPFIPVIRINNKEEEKEVDVEGEKKLVKIPAKKGFLIKIKDGDEYKEEFYRENLEGVVLKERYELQSKFNIKDRYYSYEFDNWSEPIKVYDVNHNVLIEAPYSQLKEHFQTDELDKMGNKKKTFELYLILYLNIDGEVKRFRWKMSQNNKWFDYKNSFGEDTYVGYKTKFNLERTTAGDNDFWIVNYEKGEAVNLKEQIELQKQVLSFMGALKQTFNDDDKWQQGPSCEDGNQVFKGQVIEEEVNIEDIPF